MAFPIYLHTRPRFVVKCTGKESGYQIHSKAAKSGSLAGAISFAVSGSASSGPKNVVSIPSTWDAWITQVMLKHIGVTRSCQVVQRFGDVRPHRAADDPGLGLVPTDPGGVEMVLQPRERPDRQPDVVALRPRRPDLGPLHAAARLQAPVIILDRPALLGVGQAGQLVHQEVVGRPVFNVTVSGDHLEDPDRPEPLQMNDRPTGGDLDSCDGPVS